MISHFFTLHIFQFLLFLNLTKESEEGVWEIAQFCSQLTSLYLESPASQILASLPHWTSVRLKLDINGSLSHSLKSPQTAEAEQGGLWRGVERTGICPAEPGELAAGSLQWHP